MEAWKKSRAALRAANEYVGLIGKPQWATSKFVGRLHGSSVKTQIKYKEAHGAKNYHECAEFDFALNRVIQRRFAELSAEALSDMRKQVEKDGKEARESVVKMLEEIDAFNA